MEYDREFLTGTVGVLLLTLLNEREMYGYELPASCPLALRS
jgi:DNA-binding PadR family transcriptional regulator